MITFEAETYDDAQRAILGELLHNPEYVSGVKGAITKEALSVTVRVRDPRARISSSPTMAKNYGPAVGWILRMLTTDAAAAEGRNKVIETLVKNPSSRMAVISEPGGMLQFFIRDNRLHMHCTFVKSDVVVDFTELVFGLTLVQEVIMLNLRERVPHIDLGEAVFCVGSMYLNERHFGLAAMVAAEVDRSPARMLALDDLADLNAVALDEAALREHGLISAGGYRGAAAWMFDKLLSYRMYRDSATAWPRYAPVMAS